MANFLNKHPNPNQTPKTLSKPQHLERSKPSINHKVMPAHILSLVGRQEHRRPRHILGLALGPLQLPGPFQHRHDPLLLQLRHHLLHRVHPQRRRDRVWRYAVHPHPVPAQLRRCGPHRPDHRRLRYRVVVRRHSAEDPRYAPGAQNAARALRDHDAGGVLDARHNGADVDGHSAVEVGHGEGGDGGRQGAGHAGVVVEDVEAAVEGDGEVDGGGEVGLMGDVAGDEGGVVAELVGGGCAELVVYVGDDDLGAVADEFGCGGLADAAPGAGYQCDLASQPALK